MGPYVENLTTCAATCYQDIESKHAITVSLLLLNVLILLNCPTFCPHCVVSREGGDGCCLAISKQFISPSISSCIPLIDWLRLGDKHRATASTNMNATSSRSHAVFSIVVTQATVRSSLRSD
jgi:hypothetical protein